MFFVQEIKRKRTVDRTKPVVTATEKKAACFRPPDCGENEQNEDEPPGRKTVRYNTEHEISPFHHNLRLLTYNSNYILKD